jgi:hypothetical protein
LCAARQPRQVQCAPVHRYSRLVKRSSSDMVTMLTCSWWHQSVESTLARGTGHICRRANTFISLGSRLCNVLPSLCNAVHGRSDRRHPRFLPPVNSANRIKLLGDQCSRATHLKLPLPRLAKPGRHLRAFCFVNPASGSTPGRHTARRSGTSHSSALCARGLAMTKPCLQSGIGHSMCSAYNLSRTTDGIWTTCCAEDHARYDTATHRLRRPSAQTAPGCGPGCTWTCPPRCPCHC